jgi:RNA polymerase sigma-70 factor (subfamily 1)
VASLIRPEVLLAEDPEDSSVLLRRAREGSRDALDTLLGACGDRLLAFIRLRLGPSLRSQLESGDILQTTLMHAFQHIDQFAGASRKSLIAWLVGIAQNAIRDEVDYFQRQRRDVKKTVPLSEAEEAVAAEVRTEVSRLILKEETTRLEKALESLDPVHREVVLLRKYEELSFQEIGERLGRSPDACRMLLARALTELTAEVRGRGKPQGGH